MAEVPEVTKIELAVSPVTGRKVVYPIARAGRGGFVDEQSLDRILEEGVGITAITKKPQAVKAEMDYILANVRQIS